MRGPSGRVIVVSLLALVLVVGCSSGSGGSAAPTSTAAGSTAAPSVSRSAPDGPCALPAGATVGTETPNVLMTAMFEQLGAPTLKATQTSPTGVTQYTYCYADANQVQVDQAVSYLIGAGYTVDAAAAAPTPRSAVFATGSRNLAPRFVSFLVGGSITVPTTAVTPSGSQPEGSGGLEISWQD